MLDKKKLMLYAITDPAYEEKKPLDVLIREAAAGGVRLIQLREKNLSKENFLNKAMRAKSVCDQHGVLLIINDDIDIALKVCAAGVHVGLEDAPVEEIRRKAGKDFIIGATAKTVDQALQAEKCGADYLGVGAVFPSPTKRQAVRITKEELGEITESVTIPCVAIGGITQENIDELAGTGISGVAVVSAIFGAEDIIEAAQRLKQKTERVIG